MPLTFQPCHGDGLFYVQLTYVNGAFLIHVDHRDIAVGAEADRAFFRRPATPRRVLTGDFTYC
jgi:hypothetical protein